MNAKIYQRMEIAFWDVIVQALTESRLVRYLVWNFYHVFSGKNGKRTRTWILLVSLAGFLIGLTSGIVIFSIRLYI